ncbi:MFS transporter [Streptacidiphilus cavernicola]|uniref:MFS transporter n=1 Tax=Streptacidiphilus cavernicola TaxID=3342716 RepID=A0ABV6VPH0_9ACTN
MASPHPVGRAERLLVPAAFITALGNNVQLIAGALLVIKSDPTMLAVGWLFIAVAVPQALLSPFFGRLVDRFDRRRLWIGSDLTSAVTALALPVWLAWGGAPGPGIYLAGFALAVVSALFFPASAALIKERVRSERLRSFNANYEMATQAGMLLSATVGGLAVQAFGAVPLLLVNAGTFAVSALCVIGVGRRPAAALAGPALPETAASAAAEAPTAPTGAGFPMGWLILLFAQGSVVVTVFNALLPKLVLGELHRGAGTFGAIDALGSLGFLFATGAYKVLGRRFGDLGVATTAFLLCDVLFVLEPQFGVIGLAVQVPLGAFVFGQARIASRNLLMASVDATRVGRAFGLANGGGLAATVVAMLLVATVTDHSDTRYGFAATAVLSATAALATAVRLRRPARTAAPAPAVYQSAVH